MFPGCPGEGAAQLSTGRQSPERRAVLRMQPELEQAGFQLLGSRTSEQVVCTCPRSRIQRNLNCEEDSIPSTKEVRTVSAALKLLKLGSAALCPEGFGRRLVPQFPGRAGAETQAKGYRETRGRQGWGSRCVSSGPPQPLGSPVTVTTRNCPLRVSKAPSEGLNHFQMTTEPASWR